jgi:hypothetical protein
VKWCHLIADMSGYYEQKLAPSSLERVYELAPPRVRQYLRAEVDFVVGRLRPTDVVLDLGCGYSRTTGHTKLLQGDRRALWWDRRRCELDLRP